jgi:spermidine synthase
LGALGTGWYLAGTYGYETTLWIGAGLSGFVGLSALLLAGQFTADDRTTAASATNFSLRGVAPEVWHWCALTFASGFMAISLELIWFRLLDVSLKSNAYTFAYLLAFFLAGDGVGTLIAIRFLKHAQRPRQLFLWIIAFVSLYSLAAVWLLTFLARTYAPFTNYVSQTEGLKNFSWSAPSETWLIYLAFPVLLMLVPTILFGFYFPMVQQGVQQDVAQVGQRVGLIKLANIFGNATGGIVTGLIFLEYWGSAGALRIIGALGLLFALLLLRENWASFGRLPRLAGAGLGLTLIAFALLFPTNQQLWADLHGAKAGDLFITAEDSTGVAAIRQTPGQPAIMFANGQSQATIPFLSLHGLLGSLPALVHPQPEKVLIIGIGSAGTPYAAGVNPATQHITAIEIIGSELDVLRAYQHLPGGEPLARFFADERYTILIGDGRRELALTDTLYDVIQADAIRPTSSHSGLLYSEEFFTAVLHQLAPGGIMAQWRATEGVEVTFTAVFPHVVNVGNFILLGSNQPIPYDAQAVLAKLSDPVIAEYLRAGSYNPDEMRPWIEAPPYIWNAESPRAGSPRNTDLHPRDEYYLNQP